MSRTAVVKGHCTHDPHAESMAMWPPLSSKTAAMRLLMLANAFVIFTLEVLMATF